MIATDLIAHRLSFAVCFTDHFSGTPVADELPVRLEGSLLRPAKRADGSGARQSDGSYRFIGAPGGTVRILWRDPFQRTHAGWTRFDADPEVTLPLVDPAARIAIDLWPTATAAAPVGALGVRGKLVGPDAGGQTVRIARQGTAFDRMTLSDQNGEFLFLPPGRMAENASGLVPLTIEVLRPDASPRILGGGHFVPAAAGTPFPGAGFAVVPRSISRVIFTLT
ncbi:hypothetical protein [Sphingomonas psychrotolerans]|uniref:Uncharacterized protein n=1 Tax=Sphingomonas psychrotolerans TaxID=1327635 RepID=A0A2K8MAL3_9SPHN|nr:hypothetical protein [Sphingomonas psychrotolerans]ATY30922.1 hypothetical protein CVN68_02075 [Sphingomonas psychrotolerans]